MYVCKIFMLLYSTLNACYAWPEVLWEGIIFCLDIHCWSAIFLIVKLASFCDMMTSYNCIINTHTHAHTLAHTHTQYIVVCHTLMQS